MQPHPPIETDMRNGTHPVSDASGGDQHVQKLINFRTTVNLNRKSGGSRTCPRAALFRLTGVASNWEQRCPRTSALPQKPALPSDKCASRCPLGGYPQCYCTVASQLNDLDISFVRAGADIASAVLSLFESLEPNGHCNRASSVRAAVPTLPPQPFSGIFKRQRMDGFLAIDSCSSCACDRERRTISLVPV
jgi:hypothetical protein